MRSRSPAARRRSTTASTINGRILLTANGDTVNNSGIFNANSSSDFGAGADVFNNSGTLRVLGQSATAGTVTLTGLETFNNSGLVDLRNGHVGDVLALPGTYTGTGAAQLGLDVNLGTSTFTGDQLRVGGAADGLDGRVDHAAQLDARRAQHQRRHHRGAGRRRLLANGLHA